MKLRYILVLCLAVLLCAGCGTENKSEGGSSNESSAVTIDFSAKEDPTTYEKYANKIVTITNVPVFSPGEDTQSVGYFGLAVYCNNESSLDFSKLNDGDTVTIKGRLTEATTVAWYSLNDCVVE